jgi:hypothetical protein
MKILLRTLFVVGLIVGTSDAEDANGLRVTVQKTMLERDKNRGSAYEGWDKISKGIGLKVAARNMSFKDMPEGSVEYVIIVQRWGRMPEVFESYSGTEKLPALLKGTEANLTVGNVPLSGYEAGGNRKQFQDSLEGWQVTVKHADKETIKITSNQDFEKLAKKAKPGKPPKAEK